MKPSEILKQARDLIDTPDKWCKKAMARNREGNRVSNWDPNACAWCAVGACLHACGDSIDNIVCLSETPIYPFLYEVVSTKYVHIVDTLSELNDRLETTHEMIMGVFNDAIQLAEEAGK